MPIFESKFGLGDMVKTAGSKKLPSIIGEITSSSFYPKTIWYQVTFQNSKGHMQTNSYEEKELQHATKDSGGSDGN